MLSGERNSNVWLIMYAAVYADLSGTLYKRQTEPVTFAKHGERNTAVAHVDTNTIHKKERRLYYFDRNIDENLKQKVIAAVKGKISLQRSKGTCDSMPSRQRTSWITSWIGMGIFGNRILRLADRPFRNLYMLTALLMYNFRAWNIQSNSRRTERLPLTPRKYSNQPITLLKRQVCTLWT